MRMLTDLTQQRFSVRIWHPVLRLDPDIRINLGLELILEGDFNSCLFGVSHAKYW
jgi:hypothetical protein